MSGRERLRLEDALATPSGKARYVRRLFATIAPRYDLITRVLSFGLDQGWKRRLIALCRPGPANSVLDLACGTGDLAWLSARSGAHVTGLDLTPGMVQRAREKLDGVVRVRWLVADMTAVPIRSGLMDLVTVGYGLRNVVDLDTALRESFRVLREGGRLASLDFNRPEPRFVRAIYLAYLKAVGGALGWLLHGDPDTYRYIPASIARYPGAAGVAERMRAAGFEPVRAVPVLAGLMTIHVAEKPFVSRSSTNIQG